MLEERQVLALAAPVHYDTGAHPQAIVSADFNNDGILDLAVANYVSSDVGVLLGNPEGTFQPALTSPTRSNPVSIAVGDLDGDGILDLVTAGGDGRSGALSVLLGENDGSNRGTGEFRSPTIELLGMTPTSVAVGDFDGDGRLDLAATSTYSSFYYGYYYYATYSYAQVLLGNGTGDFATPNSTWLGYGRFTAATKANFDGSGSDDLVAVNSEYGYYDGTVAVLTGDASGFLQSPNKLYTGTDAVAVAVGDVNADGELDIVTADGHYSSVSVLLANGAGGFAVSQRYFVNGYTSSVVLGDFNHDSKIDIATNSGGSTINVLNILYGQGAGTFAVPVAVPNPGGYDLVADDFNGDGWLDAATANGNANNVSVLLNDQAWSSAPASLTISDVEVTEGNVGMVAANFTVTRSGEDLSGTVTVNYNTANGGALAGSDYVSAAGMLTFGPGETTKTITIQIIGDLTDEYDQGFYVNLANASNAVIVDGQGFGIILDDDDAPTISITPIVSAKEGPNNKTTWLDFVVTLSAASEKQVRVNFATVNDTATTADNDYVATSGTLVFAPGVTSQTISVQVKGDKTKESNEQFFVDLSGAWNATIASARGIGEILDDDTPGGKRNR